MVKLVTDLLPILKEVAILIADAGYRLEENQYVLGFRNIENFKTPVCLYLIDDKDYSGRCIYAEGCSDLEAEHKIIEHFFQKGIYVEIDRKEERKFRFFEIIN